MDPLRLQVHVEEMVEVVAGGVAAVVAVGVTVVVAVAVVVTTPQAYSPEKVIPSYRPCPPLQATMA